MDGKDSECTLALILSPTRELAQQTYAIIREIGKYTTLRFSLLVGGQMRKDNIYDLQNEKPHCIIGTPGRVNDMIRDGYLSLLDTQCIVMDEADELLSNTFEAQIRYIVEHIGESTQIGLYSATMPPDKLEIAERFMQDPIHILVKAEELTLEGISQFYIYMDRDDWKYETLQDLYAAVQIYQLMIYCNSKKRVDMLARRLSDAGLTCSCIHGELSSQERVDTMRKFRTGENRILITTDLLARGIDVQQVSLVINYDIPFDMENYIHRIGRSGRFGRKGVSLNFVAGQRDAAQIKKIENYYHTQINEFPSDVESAFRNIS
jgi:superfamily II DNA/RNA helicase